ncbi:Uncharacterised protein [Mycobacterium tuberculosis]|nr:Uncharacterised protein [Mycobacterium tuberculosis]
MSVSPCHIAGRCSERPAHCTHPPISRSSWSETVQAAGEGKQRPSRSTPISSSGSHGARHRLNRLQSSAPSPHPAAASTIRARSGTRCPSRYTNAATSGSSPPAAAAPRRCRQPSTPASTTPATGSAPSSPTPVGCPVPACPGCPVPGWSAARGSVPACPGCPVPGWSGWSAVSGAGSPCGVSRSGVSRSMPSRMAWWPLKSGCALCAPVSSCIRAGASTSASAVRAPSFHTVATSARNASRRASPVPDR